jgi:DNA-binding transcriptional regulator YiaG
VDKNKICSYVLGMSPEQSRAARGWLGWSQTELATRSRVSLSTVRDFETRARSPIPNNIAAMRRVVEAAGIELIDEDGRAVGIKCRVTPTAVDPG